MDINKSFLSPYMTWCPGTHFNFTLWWFIRASECMESQFKYNRIQCFNRTIQLRQNKKTIGLDIIWSYGSLRNYDINLHKTKRFTDLIRFYKSVPRIHFQHIMKYKNTYFEMIVEYLLIIQIHLFRQRKWDKDENLEYNTLHYCKKAFWAYFS